MAAVTAAPFAINTMTVDIDGTTFENAVSRAEAVPNYASPTIDTVDGTAHALDGGASWVLNIDYAQDWVTSGALADYLVQHDGEEATITITAQTGGKVLTADVFLRAGAYGGQAKQAAIASVQLPIKGKPSIAAGA